MKRNKNFIIHIESIRSIAKYLGLSILSTVRYVQDSSGRLIMFSKPLKKNWYFILKEDILIVPCSFFTIFACPLIIHSIFLYFQNIYKEYTKEKRNNEYRRL